MKHKRIQLTCPNPKIIIKSNQIPTELSLSVLITGKTLNSLMKKSEKNNKTFLSKKEY